MKRKKNPQRGQTPVVAQSNGATPADLQQFLDALPVNKELIEQANLGASPQTCRVCGTAGNFQTWLAREMMQGTHDKFRYFVCDNCDCLQIETVPENLGDYYQGGYYSYARPSIVPLPPGTEQNNDFILDVGCGAGFWLCEKATEGYQFLFGCDPFIEKDIYYTNNVQIRKCTIHEMFGQFDLVRLGDSFEHVTDPMETMQSIKRLLKPVGRAELLLPIYPNTAFDVYGPYWYQLDAPRHIFLHSIKSLRYLADRCGLVIDHVDYYSGYTQYAISHLYQMGISFPKGNLAANMEKIFTKQEIEVMNAVTLYANQQQRSDHATVFFRHR